MWLIGVALWILWSLGASATVAEFWCGRGSEEASLRFVDRIPMPLEGISEEALQGMSWLGYVTPRGLVAVRTPGGSDLHIMQLEEQKLSLRASVICPAPGPDLSESPADCVYFKGSFYVRQSAYAAKWHRYVDGGESEFIELPEGPIAAGADGRILWVAPAIWRPDFRMPLSTAEMHRLPDRVAAVYALDQNLESRHILRTADPSHVVLFGEVLAIDVGADGSVHLIDRFFPGGRDVRLWNIGDRGIVQAWLPLNGIESISAVEAGPEGYSLVLDGANQLWVARASRNELSRCAAAGFDPTLVRAYYFSDAGASICGIPWRGSYILRLKLEYAGAVRPGDAR